MTVFRVDSAPFAQMTPPEGIRPIEPLGQAGPAEGASAHVGAADGTSFEALLGDALHEANQADAVASEKTKALAAGTIDDIHGTMIAVKEADITVKLVGTVRNKILDAFQELWKTSV
jgi:flagellar hook-basal body complex protein FliE